MLTPLRNLASKINWWVGLAGNIALVYTAITSGALAGVLVVILAYALSFWDFVASLPLALRVGFYLCVFVLAFAIINHTRQRLPVWWARRRSGLTDEELKQRLRTLSEQIYELYGDWKQEEDQIIYGHHFEISQASTEVEQQRLHNRQVQESSRNFGRVMAKYSRSFETLALSLFDDAIERGMATNVEDRCCLENPNNPLGVRQVAQILGTIGNKS